MEHGKGGGGGGGGGKVGEGESGCHRENNQHHQKVHHFLRQGGGIAIFLGMLLVTCFALYHAASRLELFSGGDDGRIVLRPSSISYHDSGGVELRSILKKTATKDRTVIITTLKGAWSAPDSVFDLFLESFKIGLQTEPLVNNLVVVAMDERAYNRCVAVHPHCYDLTTKDFNFSGEANLAMMWKRIDFLTTILELGYNFIFTDADIMWFRNPFARFYKNADFQIACDYFWGNPPDLNNQPDRGFNYVRSNKRTIQFYRFWYKSRENHPGLHDQDVLNQIISDPFIHKIKVKIRFLNTAYFGGFCQPSRDLGQVCTMHANCCFGLDNKVHDLKVMLGDWKRFLSLEPTAWTVPQNCSTNNFHPPDEEEEKAKQQEGN